MASNNNDESSSATPEETIAALRRRVADLEETLESVQRENNELREDGKELKQLAIELLESGEPVEWDELPEKWREGDVDFVVAVVRGQGVPYYDLPEKWKENAAVARAGLLRSSDGYYWGDWEDLPSGLQNSIEFARSFSYFPNCCVPKAIMEHFSELRRDRDFWIHCFDSIEDYGDLPILIQDWAPTELRSAHGFMIRACQSNYYAVELVHSTLGQNRSFVEEVLKIAPMVLEKLSHESQRLFPDLVAQALELLGQDSSVGLYYSFRNLHGNILPEFWERRSFVLKWFESSFPFIDDRPRWNYGMPLSWKNDKEIFLCVAKCCRENCRHESFSKASESLRSNKDFLREALKLDPNLFDCAVQSLQHDLKLAVFVFANPRFSFDRYLSVGRNHRRALIRGHSIAIASHLIKYDEFFALLCGVSSASSTLSVLNQGTETSVNYKRRIAEFLDVPTGQYLCQLRRAGARSREALNQ